MRVGTLPTVYCLLPPEPYVVRGFHLDLEEPFQNRWGLESLTRSSLTYWRKSRRRVKRSEHIGSIVKYDERDYREGNRLLI